MGLRSSLQVKIAPNARVDAAPLGPLVRDCRTCLHHGVGMGILELSFVPREPREGWRLAAESLRNINISFRIVFHYARRDSNP